MAEKPFPFNVCKECCNGGGDTDEKIPKWKTLHNVTLTEEQAGVTSLLLAIEDIETFANAKQIRFAMSFPVAEEKAANAFWTNVKIQNDDATKYNVTFLAGYNKKGNANATYHAIASINIIDVNFYKTVDTRKTFHSIIQLPNPYYGQSANTVGTATEATGYFPSEFMKKTGYAPYLNISTGSVTMQAGTRVFLEVCEV